MSVAADVRQVRWFADGQLVCTAEVAPFSCEWDAGSRVDEHVIRAVAVLKSGPQLVANARTRAVEYAEAVDVDVVQVTAVVTDGAGRFVTGLKADGLQGLRGRQAAAAHDLRGREHSARARHRGRRELQHDRRAARGEASRDDVPVAVARPRSGHGARLQRQHLHAGAAVHRPDGPRAGDRAAGAVGRHRALRRHPPCLRPARPPGRTALAGRLQRRGGSVESRGDARGAQARGGIRCDGLYDRTGPRAARAGAAAVDEAARERQRRPRLLLRR